MRHFCLATLYDLTYEYRKLEAYQKPNMRKYHNVSTQAQGQVSGKAREHKPRQASKGPRYK